MWLDRAGKRSRVGSRPRSILTNTKTQKEKLACTITPTKTNRPERWIVTIPSSDQWLATIGNHWKTIATNGFWTQKPLENHYYQWFWWPKTIGKPLLPMVLETKNHRTTIDINGGFPTICSMAMVSMKTVK